MHFHIKRDEDITSLAGNDLCAPFEDTGLCPGGLTLSPLHILVQIPPPRVPSHPHTR